MYMLIKYEGVVKVFNENIHKIIFCAFFGCHTIFEHDHPLKTSEKHRFSDVFRGYRNACSWKLQVFLSMCDLLVDTKNEKVLTASAKSSCLY